MLNNNNNLNKLLNNITIYKNKYFLVLCFYLKKKNNNNLILNSLFIGYKYNYLFLNINIFIKTIKNFLNIFQEILLNNGELLFLYTKNKIINYILQQNCKKYNMYYLKNFDHKQYSMFQCLKFFPDGIVSFDYKSNAIFLNKIVKYNIPVFCITNSLNTNIIENKMYYLILNNNSLYSNIIIIALIFNQIYKSKQKLGIQFLN